MARVRARPETGALYLDFFFKGRRCREQTALPDTPANRRRLQAVLDRLMKDVKSGAFDYARFFARELQLPRLEQTGHETSIARRGHRSTEVAPQKWPRAAGQFLGLATWSPWIPRSPCPDAAATRTIAHPPAALTDDHAHARPA